MKIISKYISPGFVVLSSFLLSSCINEYFAEETVSVDSKRNPSITITVLPISLGNASAEVTEMIKSLRIIMLSEVTLENGMKESYVEYNQLFDFQGEYTNDEIFSGPGEVASTFRLIITRNSVPGLKKFFLVANEGMIEEIKFQTESTLPQGITEGMALHEFLSHYGADFIENLEYPDIDSTPEKGKPKGFEFESLLNCLYYTPEFSQKQQSMGDGSQRNVIFLPYSSYYSYEMATVEDIQTGQSHGINILDSKMYLVPSATKFRFEFQNYRPHPVTIPSFKLAGMASDMFLFAQVGTNENKDKWKDFGDEKNLWWIDWVAKVNELSKSIWNPDDNLSFSSAFGWIQDYSIPNSAIDKTVEEIMDNDTRYGVIELVKNPNEPWEVPKNTTGDPIQGPPGTLKTGYFYFPESRYMVDFKIYNDNGELEEIQSNQAYYLKLSMISGENGDLRAVKDTQIGNLGSLFRSTDTYITIKMRDALDVGAYAQIEAWEESHTNGTVQEEYPDE